MFIEKAFIEPFSLMKVLFHYHIVTLFSVVYRRIIEKHTKIGKFMNQHATIEHKYQLNLVMVKYC